MTMMSSRSTSSLRARCSSWSMRQEARFRITESLDPDRYRQLLGWAQQNVSQRYGVYEQLAKVVVPQATTIPDVRPPPAVTPE